MKLEGRPEAGSGSEWPNVERTAVPEMVRKGVKTKKLDGWMDAAKGKRRAIMLGNWIEEEYPQTRVG